MLPGNQRVPEAESELNADNKREGRAERPWLPVISRTLVLREIFYMDSLVN